MLMRFECLQELGLNEVFSGGLSSYSIVNMVMAYLSLEGMSLAAHMQPGLAALPEISHTVSSPPPAQQDVAWRMQQTFSESCLCCLLDGENSKGHLQSLRFCIRQQDSACRCAEVVRAARHH